MDESILKLMARQLRKPEGELGKQVGVQMNIGNKLMNEWTIEQVNMLPGNNILEIGMGNGAFVGNLFAGDGNTRYTGCDYSELMIEEASKVNSQYVESGQAKFYLSDADNLPFGSDLFDKVFTINTVYFWASPSKELSEIRRVLKPGGIFTICIRPKFIMEKLPFTEYGFIMYSKEELVNLLSNNHFNILNIIEKDEPEQEQNGQTVKLQTLIISAGK